MADVSLTQSATLLVEADVAAGVADDVTFDPTRPTRILTRPGQRPDPVNGQPGQRSTTRRVNGQTRPGQRSTTRRVNGQTRPGQHSPEPVARAATRCHTRRTFWWRVRARVRVFLGNFGTCRFVSKLSTMWYIDFSCLKLLQI